jgi:hypothetical protein
MSLPPSPDILWSCPFCRQDGAWRWLPLRELATHLKERHQIVIEEGLRGHAAPTQPA